MLSLKLSTNAVQSHITDENMLSLYLILICQYLEAEGGQCEHILIGYSVET